MSTIKEMQATLVESAAIRSDVTAKKVEQLQYDCSEYQRRLKTLGAFLPGIETTLAKMGLAITQLGYRSSGQTSDGVWTVGTSLIVGIEAESVADKFKFIKFNGYDAHGASRNRKQLDDKAAKIEACIAAVLGTDSVSVDPYSLETKPGNRVLITLWIK
jgi:hypothetical protein